MEEKLIGIYQDIRQSAGKFQKKTYVSEIERLEQRHKDTLDKLRHCLDELQEIPATYGTCVADHVQEELKPVTSGRKRGILILDHNMSMAAYFLPLLRKNCGEKADQLTASITAAWNQNFPEHKIESPTFEEIRDGFRSGLCYVTTAVCKSLHKPDDCRELTLLRNYRDTFMLETAEREKIVKEYYNVAPTIVKRIDRREDADEIYGAIWEQYLSRCIRLIEAEKPEECEKVYIRMVQELETRYLYQ